MSDSNLVEVVDDRDVRIEYSSGWQAAGVIQEYNGTTHGTFTAGSQAKFTFQGSSVGVYGTLSDNRFGIPVHAAPISTYVLDGSPPTTFSPPFQHGLSYKQLFYQSSNLNDKEHTLIITCTLSDTSFWLDYFQITPSIPSSSSSLPPGVASQTSVNSSVTSAVNPVPVGAIAGGVIGGVVLMLLACLLLLLYRRQKRSRKTALDFGIQPYDVNNINPFLTPRPLAQETRENENTRFPGAISPFTSHQSRPSASGSGGLRENLMINPSGGPVVSQAMEKSSYFGHPVNPLPLERAMRPEDRVSPQGQRSTSSYVTDSVTVDTPPAYEPRR